MTSCVYIGDELASYGFGNNHPFGPQRHHAFESSFKDQGLDLKTHILNPVLAERAVIELFHTPEYVTLVEKKSRTGKGCLDYGDTPAFKGVYEAASYVVGTVIDAVDRLLAKEYSRAFVPISGLHHATRAGASGFCAFNDCGIAIEYLKTKGIKKVLYVDIDAHHGDGVFYAFEEDEDVIFVDIHESGDYLYPGTGSENETGKGKAEGTKLNIPVLPGATDETFFTAWHDVENFLEQFQPEFILLQCGADSLEGDPITHMKYSAKSHAYATRALVDYASKHAQGRILAMGGGGYNLENIAAAWTSVVKELI